MQIDKAQILQMLMSRGQSDTAQQADSQLPDTVDTDHPGHQNILSSLGINAGELGALGGLAGGLGGGGGGGIEGIIGKIL